MADAREGGLLRWQWALYPDNHTRRATLAVHLATVPLFWSGCVALGAAAARGPWWLAPAGLAALGVALAAQGRTHRQEPVAPVPFRGPLDVIARLLVEQWITFPRFVLSGAFARAWRGRPGDG